MQPSFSFQLDPAGPSPPSGSQNSVGGFQHLGEKQLFEKFWKGTFKAVATPRPESVIVASITARRRVADSVTTVCEALKTDERRAAKPQVDTSDRNGCIKGSRRKHHSHRRARSSSYDDIFSPRPKGKKKKRKSDRKRKRKRAPSYSLSPVRKKKKKKKKSSKKSKRHRHCSKKSKHSSSSFKRKRKDERKHKKSSRTRSHRRRRYRRSESNSSSCQPFTEDRHPVQKSVVHQAFGDQGVDVKAARAEFSHTTKSVCKTAPKYRSILSTCTILPPKSGSKVSGGNGSQCFSGCTEAPRDYDSGNDTSSPPSSKTGISHAIVNEYKRPSMEKLRFSERDDASDSGNSVTSYASSCRPYGDCMVASLLRPNSKSEQMTFGCQVEIIKSSRSSSCGRRRRGSSTRRIKRRSSSSRSRSPYSESSRCSGRYSQSPSPSSSSSYSRSQSISSVRRRRGSTASISSRESYSRSSDDRQRKQKRAANSRTKHTRHTQKVGGKRRRRRSYSPMKKRRRDSPSHLEARRITSARKRPIPYFRRSPSSSSSVSSWSSLFSRSRSVSSYRSYSRSSSWNSLFGSRSRSSSLDRHKKSRH